VFLNWPNDPLFFKYLHVVATVLKKRIDNQYMWKMTLKKGAPYAEVQMWLVRIKIPKTNRVHDVHILEANSCDEAITLAVEVVCDLYNIKKPAFLAIVGAKDVNAVMPVRDEG
jgi:hypothetical protein